MALVNAVKGSTHTPEAIAWVRADGAPQDLTGATLTAEILRFGTGTARAVTGTLTPLEPRTDGVFTWRYSSGDVAESGDFRVQFTATYPDTSADVTYSAPWTVGERIGL